MPFPSSFDEKEILSQIAAGDEVAFTRLFKHYHQLLGTYVLRFTRSREVTEEIVQDVFMKIWLNRTALSEVVEFKAYLFAISKNHVLNCLKKIAKERVITLDLEDNVLVQDFIETSADNGYYQLIDEAIDHLPPQQQKVYLMSRHERLKYAEIALKLNLSKETVKKYLQISSDSISSYIRNRLVTKSIIILITFFLLK